MEIYRFTTKQKGYGRQGLYADGKWVMDVFPNIKECFNIIHEDDSFWDEETETYTDCGGHEVRVYKDMDEWLSVELQPRLEEMINDGLFDF